MGWSVERAGSGEGRRARRADRHFLATSIVRNNIVTPYLRTRLQLRDRDLRIDAAGSFLGILPVGRREAFLRVEDLRSIERGLQFRLDRLVVAIALGWSALVIGVQALAIVLGLLAVWLLPLSLIAVLRIEDRDSRRAFAVCWIQRGPVDAFVRQVDRARAYFASEAIT